MFWIISSQPTAKENQSITADSIPNHDGWGPDTYWSCLDWIDWHKALVAKYGKEKADKIWVTHYDQSSWGAHEINCSTYNDEFKTYVKKQGLDKKSSILTRVYRAEGAVDNVGAPIRDVGGAIGNTAKVLKYAIPALVTASAIGIIIYGYNKYLKT